jgi:WD40 repeat protein
VDHWTDFAEIPVKGVMCLAFSPDGKVLAVGCKDGTVKLFSVPKLKD